MAATSARRRTTSGLARAPPPTPIATGKGSRSAAVDDRVLSEYLESTLQIPDLSLPESHFPRRSPRRIPPGIGFEAIVSGDDALARIVVETVEQIGVVRIDGGVAVEDVRAAVEAGREVFGIPAEKRSGLGEFFRNEDGIEEFYWARPMGSETGAEWPITGVREKLERISSNLQMVAECIAKILSQHMKNQRRIEKISKNEAVLCFRKHELHRHGHNRSTESSFAKDHRHSYALSLCLSGDDREFCVRNGNGSSSFVLPAGSIIVSITKELEEHWNGQFKSASVEAIVNHGDDDCGTLSLEFMCLPAALDSEIDHITKTISIMDQLLMLLLLAFLYKLWM